MTEARSEPVEVTALRILSGDDRREAVYFALERAKKEVKERLALACRELGLSCIVKDHYGLAGGGAEVVVETKWRTTAVSLIRSDYLIDATDKQANEYIDAICHRVLQTLIAELTKRSATNA